MTENFNHLKRWSIFYSLFSSGKGELSVDYLLDMREQGLIETKDCPCFKEKFDDCSFGRVPGFLDKEDYFVFQSVVDVEKNHINYKFFSYFYASFKKEVQSFFKKEENLNFFIELCAKNNHTREERKNGVNFYFRLILGLLSEENGFFSDQSKEKIFRSAWLFSPNDKQSSSFLAREELLEYFMSNQETKFGFVKKIKNWEFLFCETKSEKLLGMLLKTEGIDWSIEKNSHEKTITLTEKYSALFPSFKKEISDASKKFISNEVIELKYSEFVRELLESHNFEFRIKKGPSLGEVLDWAKYKTKTGFPLFLLSFNKDFYLSNKVQTTNKGLKEMSFSFLEKLKNQNPHTPHLPSWLEYGLVSNIDLKVKELKSFVHQELEERIKEVVGKDVIYPYFSCLDYYIDNFDLIEEGLSKKVYKEIYYLFGREEKKTSLIFEKENGPSFDKGLKIFSSFGIRGEAVNFDKVLKIFSSFGIRGEAVNKFIFGAPNLKSQTKLLELISGKNWDEKITENMSALERFNIISGVGEDVYKEEGKYRDLYGSQKSFFTSLSSEVEIIPEVFVFTLLCKSNWGSVFDAKEKMIKYLSESPMERLSNGDWREYIEIMKKYYEENPKEIGKSSELIKLFEERMFFIDVVKENKEKVKVENRNPLRF